MAQVPYEPYPKVAPSVEGAKEIAPQIVPGAFGVGIGQAIEGLGKQAEHSGDQIWRTALQLQDMQNREAAMNASVQMYKETSQKRADFLAKEGANAGPEALIAHQNELEAIQKKYRGALTTPMAQRYYDAETRVDLAKGFIAAAQHSGNETKRAYVQSLGAANQLSYNRIAEDPSEETFQDELGKIRKTVNAANAYTGRYETSAEEAQAEAEAEAYWVRLRAIARRNAPEGSEFYERNKDKFGKYTLEAQQFSDGQMNQSGSRYIARGVMEEVISSERQGKPEITEAQAVKMAEDEAERLHPGNPDFKNFASHATQQEYTRYKARLRDSIQQANQTLAEGLQSANNFDELLAKPEMQAAYDSLPPKEQNEWPGRVTRFIKARDAESMEQEKKRLNGLIYNDKAAFLNEDLTKRPLSAGDMFKYMGLQRSMSKESARDPRVKEALKWIHGAFPAQMESLGLFKRTEVNKDDYDAFTGSLQGEIVDWKNNHNGKPPTQEEVLDKIAPKLWSTYKEPTSFFGFSTGERDEYRFKRDIPEWFTEKVYRDFQSIDADQPTKDEVRSLWWRYQQEELRKAKKKPEEPKPSWEKGVESAKGKASQ